MRPAHNPSGSPPEECKPPLTRLVLEIVDLAREGRTYCELLGPGGYSLVSVSPARGRYVVRSCFKASPGPGEPPGWAPEARLWARLISALGDPARYSVGSWTCASLEAWTSEDVQCLLRSVREAQRVRPALLGLSGVSLTAVSRVITALGAVIAERYEPDQLAETPIAGPFTAMRDIIPRAGLSKSTVYRVLRLLERSGAVRRTRRGMTAPFEAFLASEPVLVGLSRASPRHAGIVLRALLRG